MSQSRVPNEYSPLSGFEGRDLRSLIDERAEQWGDKTFLTWIPFSGAPRCWSYAAFRQAALTFAGSLQSRGLVPGDRLLVHLDNCPESLVCWLGAAYAGVVAVTTNAKSTAEELTYFIAHSRARAAVTQPRFAALVATAGPSLEWLAVTALDSGETPDGAAVAGAEPFARLMQVEAALTPRPPDPMAPFAIQYTSGTTARPKAVLWTHANALWGAKLSAMHEALTSSDVHLITLPLFHTNAQVYSVLAALEAGAAIVLQPRFSASRFWEVSLRFGCTWTSMVPFCLKVLAEAPVPPEHSYRLWGNAVCSPPSDAIFGVKTIGWWGMTETVTHGIVGSPHGINAPLSLGRPSPGYEVLVLQSDGAPASPGEAGDLLIRGRRGVSIFLEYAEDPQSTKAAFREDGLLITGDRVTLGPNGFLYFADRAKDVLKVGGENVAASEIERVISEVDGVSEVAVVGRPHKLLDEVPVAFVIGRSSSPHGELVENILALCRARLSSFKIPREVIIVDSLPRSTLNKVSKAELRDRFDDSQSR